MSFFLLQFTFVGNQWQLGAGSEAKGEVWRMLMAPIDKPSQKLELIDEIECLGVSYNFESEIDKVLQQI